MLVDKITNIISKKQESSSARRPKLNNQSSHSKTTPAVEMPSVVDNLKQMIARDRIPASATADEAEETREQKEETGGGNHLNEANDEENIVIDMEEEDDEDDEGGTNDGHLGHYAPSSAIKSPTTLNQNSYSNANKHQTASDEPPFQIGQLIWFDPNQVNYSIPGKIVDFYPELNVLTVEGCGQPLSLEDTQLDDLTRNRLLLKADEELQLYELSDQQAFRSIKLRKPITNELGFDNLLDLDELSLESVIYNLKLRQKQELVYTRCGHKILISLNPFKQLCNLYNLDQVNRYNSLTLNKLDKLTRFNSLSQQETRAMSPPLLGHGNNTTLIKWLILNEQTKSNNTNNNNIGDDFSASQQTATSTVAGRKVGDNSLANCARDSPPRLPPHIFQLANEALKKLLINCQDQCFILLGDSGSGKTESCKLLVQYLATVNKAPTNLITEQILESIQVLESFGNARTILNDNSSRFGKLLELRFNLKNGFILDAKTIDLNLLDRTRIVCQNENERNFHIFYELLAGLNKNEKEKYGLQTADKYFYLNQGQCIDLPQKDDGLDFRSLLASMQVLGFNYEEQDTIFRILASILHLGNIYFHRKVLAIRSGKVTTTTTAASGNNAPSQPPVAQQSAGIEGVEIGSDTEVRWVSHLLQVQFDLVMRCLTVRTTPEAIHQNNNNSHPQQANHQSSITNEQQAAATIVTPLNIDQALDTRDAIARALYTCLFKWLVQRINVMINSSSQTSSPPLSEMNDDDEPINQDAKSDSNNNSSRQQQRISREPIYMCKTSESLCEFQPDKMASNPALDQHYYSSSSRGGSGSRHSRAAQNDGYSPINNTNQLQHQKTATISILDAFGFENLSENNFEQLCINYAAELMNYHTNRYLSRLEQAEYVRERLRWQPIGQNWTKSQQANSIAEPAFTNNSLTSTSSSQATLNRAPASIVNLISRKPLGILALLDDECNFPKATDQSFAEKCHHNHALNENYQCARLAANCQEFGIRHFRQVNRMVWYQVDGFVEKNRDSLRPDVIELLVGSRMTIVADMLRKTHRSSDSNGNKTLSRTFDGRYVSMKPRATTVATRFQDTIHHNKVMDTLAGAASPSQPTISSQNQHYANGGDSSLASSFRSQQQHQRKLTPNPQTQSSNAWFIICVKPNRSKTAQVFDVPYVQEQAQSINLLEIVQMRQFGYPVRLRYDEFVRRFKCLVPSAFLNNLTANTRGHPQKSRLRTKQSSNNSKQQATMKKAVRDVCSSIVEYKFHHQFNGAPEVIESVKQQYQCGLTKMFLTEKLFHQLEQWRLEEYRYAIEVLQKYVRMWLVRREYLAQRRAAIVVQAHWRAHLARKSFWRQYSLIVMLQRRWRNVSQMRRKQRLEARRRALKQQEQIRLQELKEQQRKQANQFRYRMSPNNGNTNQRPADQTSHYQALRELLEIPEDLTQLYRLQKNWQPAHDLSNINQFNLLDLVEKELTCQYRHGSNSHSVPFVVINDDLHPALDNKLTKKQTTPKYQQVAEYIEQLELDERYSLHNFLSKYYTSEAPQFGYSRLPITRPFTWSKLMRLRQLELSRRRRAQQQHLDRLNTTDPSDDSQFAYKQEARAIKRRFQAIEQKSVAIYKLILRYIDSDQSLPINLESDHDNDSEKFDLEKHADRQQELVQKLLKFKLISDYINYLCLTEPLLRNEVYLQLCSQSWQHPKLRSVENTWKLFANCLSCFKPIGRNFNRFLLKYTNDFCCDKYRKSISTKLWQNLVAPKINDPEDGNVHQRSAVPITTSKQRRYPTTIIEYWANQFAVDRLAISASCYMDDHALNEQASAMGNDSREQHRLDENGNDHTMDQSQLNLTNFANKTMVQLDSHTTAEQFARDLLSSRSVPETNLAGWSVEVQHEGALSEHSSRLRGDDQLLDHFARLELLPELVQLIDDDFEAFESEQLDLMFGFSAAPAVDGVSPLSSDQINRVGDHQIASCCSPPPMSPSAYSSAQVPLNNPRYSAGNYSQYSQFQNRRHSAAMSADYDSYRTPRASRQFHRADHQQPAWLEQHGGYDDAFYKQQSHHRASSSLSNRKKLNRRSISMQELQLASSALNGRYFAGQQFQPPYGRVPSGQSPGSPPDCCKQLGQPSHQHQLAPPLPPFPTNKRLSGSLRQLEMSAPMNNHGQAPARLRSGTPNSTSGYQSSRGAHRHSSSVYGTSSTQNYPSNAQHYQQMSESEYLNPIENEMINRQMLTQRQQQTRFARQNERINSMNDASQANRRSCSSSSRTAGPTSDYASTHNSDYERIGLAPSNINQRFLNGSNSSAKFAQQQQPMRREINQSNLLRQQQQHQLHSQRQMRSHGDWDPSLRAKRGANAPRALPSPSGSDNNPKSRASKQATTHYAPSSAMSDTSEAPSLASHVRGVKVPQPNGDVDRYLDDLFNPLLDEVDLDELSDARSLATSIRGRREIREADCKVDDNLGLENLCNPLALSRIIQGKVSRQEQDPTSSKPSNEVADSSEPNDKRLSRAELSPTFESLLRGLKPTEDLVSTSTATTSDGQHTANLNKLNLSELKALNEQLESQIQAAQSARPTLGLISDLESLASSIPTPPPRPGFGTSEVASSSTAMTAFGSMLDDAYSRAKTIRIGKWRWPPAREDVEQMPASSNERKRASLLDHHELSAKSEECVENLNVGAGTREDDKLSPAPVSDSRQQQIGGLSTESEPFSTQANSAVGRLKISSEMKAKLEQLTNSSGNITAPQAKDLIESGKLAADVVASKQPRRLNEQRRNLLETQLLGSTTAQQEILSAQEVTSASAAVSGKIIAGTAGDESAGLGGGVQTSSVDKQQSRLSMGSSENAPTSPGGSKVLAVKQKLAAAAGVALASLDCNSGASSQASSRRQSSNIIGIGQASASGGDKVPSESAGGGQQMRMSRHVQNDELGPQTKAAISQRQTFYRISASSDRLDRLLSEPMGSPSSGQLGAMHSSEVQLSSQPNGDDEAAHRKFVASGLQQAQLSRTTPIASDLNEAGRSSAGAGGVSSARNNSMIERLCGNLPKGNQGASQSSAHQGNSQDNQWISTSCSPPVQVEGETRSSKLQVIKKAVHPKTVSMSSKQSSPVMPQQPPRVSAYCLSHANVDWQVRIRKEVFRPSESYDDPLVIQLIFAQLVADVFNPRHWTRLNNKERAAMKSMMKDNSIGYSPSLPPIGHMQAVKRDLIKMARSFGLYFTRSYQALNFVCLADGHSELPLPIHRRGRAHSNDDADSPELSSSSGECSSEDDEGESDRRAQERRKSIQLALQLHQSGGLGLEWIDLVAVHHSGLRLVSMVDNSTNGSQQQQQRHHDESSPTTNNSSLTTTTPPIGYKVLETLKFRDMTSVSLLCKQKLVLVNMRNGRRSWLLSSSQSSQLASLLSSFLSDYNEQVRSATSNQVVNSSSLLKQENRNRDSADAGKRRQQSQKQDSDKQQQVVGDEEKGANEAKYNNKTRINRIGGRPEDKENALLATDDDHHGDHLEQRQASDCLDQQRPATHSNNVLADRGGVLSDDLATTDSPLHERDEQNNLGPLSPVPAAAQRPDRGANGGGSCRECGLSRPASAAKPNRQLQSVCDCKLDADHGSGGGLHAGGRSNGGQLQQQSPDSKSKLSPDYTANGGRHQPIDGHSSVKTQDHHQVGQKQSRKKPNNNDKQQTNSISIWQNSLSRMSNKLNIFSSNSSKRKSASDHQMKVAGQQTKQSEASGDQEPVVLDAWIETKVDFDEENEDSSDEHQAPESSAPAAGQQKPDEQTSGARRTSSTIESGSLSQLKLKQQQPKSSQQQESDNNNETTTQKPDDGKYSMLQFALYNFREAIEKYSLAQKAKQRHENNSDTSTLRGSLKLIEFLRNGDSADHAPAGHSTTSSSSSSTLSATNGQQQPHTGGAASKQQSKDDWTWRELAEMVKFTQTPIRRSLLKLPNQDDLDRRAVECFAAIMQYMGDLATTSSKQHQQVAPGGEVECVYLILINCHNYPILRDEIYCQLIKQTTNNRSQRSSDSCLLGWRLFSIVAAYFDCSQMFKPYLMKYLEQAAYDKRRAYHSIASLCLQNLRKTFKYKGRKNVPSIEEIAATTAGRNSKRQIYRLPGGTERVINTNSTTVVDDIIHEICSNMLNVNEPDEMLEYSLYCIADGDLYTMPLNRDEYILDITTELIKNHQQYFLIFCRSIWHYPLRLDSQLYIEVIFNQIAPDYLEGLLLILPKQEKIYGTSKMISSASSAAGSHSLSLHSDHGQRKAHQQQLRDSGSLRLKTKLVKEIARLAALLHRAYGSDYIPHKDEIKYLLPKTIVGLLKHQQRILTSERLSSASSIHSNSSSSANSAANIYHDDDNPATKSTGREQQTTVVTSQKWIDLVQENCRELNAIDSLDAKAQFLDIIRHWPLFGSSFFAIKLIQRDLIQPMDFILALNKLGVQMLDVQTHEAIHKYQFNEVISTRKVRSEDGALFLDMKCGNLMRRTIIRIQTNQAHEISWLIRQYIDIEISQANKTPNKADQQRMHSENVVC